MFSYTWNILHACSYICHITLKRLKLIYKKNQKKPRYLPLFWTKFPQKSQELFITSNTFVCFWSQYLLYIRIVTKIYVEEPYNLIISLNTSTKKFYPFWGFILNSVVPFWSNLKSSFIALLYFLRAYCCSQNIFPK